MGPDDGAIHVMNSPLQLPSNISLLLKTFQEPLPHIPLSPAVEPARYSSPGTVSVPQSLPRTGYGVPRGSSDTHHPEGGIDDVAMVFVGPSNTRLPRRQQRLYSSPLRLCQVTPSHSPHLSPNSSLLV